MKVLVAGAGPVGLCAASALAEAGVAVTVLEAEPRLPENLRASTFQPPTLDLLARFGADRRLIEMGRIAPRVQYRDRAGWVAEFDFSVLATRKRSGQVKPSRRMPSASRTALRPPSAPISQSAFSFSRPLTLTVTERASCSTPVTAEA